MDLLDSLLDGLLDGNQSEIKDMNEKQILDATLSKFLNPDEVFDDVLPIPDGEEECFTQEGIVFHESKTKEEPFSALAKTFSSLCTINSEKIAKALIDHVTMDGSTQSSFALMSDSTSAVSSSSNLSTIDDTSLCNLPDDEKEKTWKLICEMLKPSSTPRNRTVTKEEISVPNTLFGLGYNPTKLLLSYNLYDAKRIKKEGETFEYEGHLSDCTYYLQSVVYGREKQDEGKVQFLPNGEKSVFIIDRKDIVSMECFLPLDTEHSAHRIPSIPTGTYERDLFDEDLASKLPKDKIDPRHYRYIFYLGDYNTNDEDDDDDLTETFIVVSGVTDFISFMRTVNKSGLPILVSEKNLVGEIGSNKVKAKVFKKDLLDIVTYIKRLGFAVSDGVMQRRPLAVDSVPSKVYQSKALELARLTTMNQFTSFLAVLRSNPILRSFWFDELLKLGKIKKSYHEKLVKKFGYYTKPCQLSIEQTFQLLDAYYWVHLAPEAERKPEFKDLLDYFENAMGKRTLLKGKYIPSGMNRGKCCCRGPIRKYRGEREKRYNSVPSSHIAYDPKSGQLVALNIAVRKPENVKKLYDMGFKSMEEFQKFIKDYNQNRDVMQLFSGEVRKTKIGRISKQLVDIDFESDAIVKKFLEMQESDPNFGKDFIAGKYDDYFLPEMVIMEDIRYAKLKAGLMIILNFITILQMVIKFLVYGKSKSSRKRGRPASGAKAMRGDVTFQNPKNFRYWVLALEFIEGERGTLDELMNITHRDLRNDDEDLIRLEPYYIGKSKKAIAQGQQIKREQEEAKEHAKEQRKEQRKEEAKEQEKAEEEQTKVDKMDEVDDEEAVPQRKHPMHGKLAHQFLKLAIQKVKSKDPRPLQDPQQLDNLNKLMTKFKTRHRLILQKIETLEHAYINIVKARRQHKLDTNASTIVAPVAPATNEENGTTMQNAQ